MLAAPAEAAVVEEPPKAPTPPPPAGNHVKWYNREELDNLFQNDEILCDFVFNVAIWFIGSVQSVFKQKYQKKFLFQLLKWEDLLLGHYWVLDCWLDKSNV